MRASVAISNRAVKLAGSQMDESHPRFRITWKSFTSRMHEFTTLSLPWRGRRQLMWESQAEAIAKFGKVHLHLRALRLVGILVFAKPSIAHAIVYASVTPQTDCEFVTPSVTGAVSKAGTRRGPAIRWSPATPRAGTLFRIIAKRTGTTISTASVSGEPIHFRTNGDTTFALAAVPIDSVNGVTLSIRCGTGGTALIRIASQRGNYRLEQLHVAPRFSDKPDSILAARLQREAEEAAAVSRGAHDTPRLWTASFIPPRASRITSGFGGGRTFNGAVTSRHMGTDFAGAVGAPVRASNRGIVRIVGGFFLGGNVIYIDHGDGVVTAYLHLSRQLVQVGDTVQRGGVIGNVGATGRVTGPHLHLITRYGGITVDPASLFAQR